jgi:hypothetical protein
MVGKSSIHTRIPVSMWVHMLDSIYSLGFTFAKAEAPGTPFGHSPSQQPPEFSISLPRSLPQHQIDRRPFFRKSQVPTPEPVEEQVHRRSTPAVIGPLQQPPAHLHVDHVTPALLQASSALLHTPLQVSTPPLL